MTISFSVVMIMLKVLLGTRDAANMGLEQLHASEVTLVPCWSR